MTSILTDAIVGVDLGTLNTVIAVTRNRNVDVIANEVSNRATPTLVGFGPKSRYLGEAAKTQESSNLKNTVGSLKRLAGRSFNEADIQTEQQFISAPLVDVNGEVGVKVSFLGESDVKFTATQLLGMYMGKIKQITETETKLKVRDLVLSVPAWFTDRQRRALIEACKIAGVDVKRLLNETTAAAFGYGVTKLDLPTAEEKPRRVVFVDIGHSTYTASVVEFRKGELVVKGTAFDRHYGGRNFDKAIYDYLQKHFHSAYKIDINESAKARYRVMDAAGRLKKILSANQQAPLNIENLMNDLDVKAMVTRQEFEAMVEQLLNRTTVPLEQALADAGLAKDDIDIVEVVGGGSRIPAIKERIQAFFGKPLSFTLNQDEAIARGCAFASVAKTAGLRLREFAIHDLVSYPIEFTWEKANDIPDEEPNLVVFSKGNSMPSTKILTFFRKRPFDLEARYYNPQELPAGTKPWIARFSIKGVKPTITGPDDFMTCKLRVRLNESGILQLDKAYSVEDQEIEEEIKEDEKKDNAPPAAENKDGDAMDTDAPKEEAKPKTRIIRKQIQKDTLPIVSATQSLSQEAENALIKAEENMANNDKAVAELEEKKNELETYVYDTRGKLYDAYDSFSNDDEKEKISQKLQEVEDWLYPMDEPEQEPTIAHYVAKKEEIDRLVGPVRQRYLEHEQKKREELEAKLAAEAAAKKEAEEAAAKEAAANGTGADGDAAAGADAEMTDAGETVKPASVEEA